MEIGEDLPSIVMSPINPGSSRSWWPRGVLVGVLLLVAGVGTWLVGDLRVIRWLIAADQLVIESYRAYPMLLMFAAACVYAAVTACSIPAATLLSLALGQYLGFVNAVVVVSFGSTAGATAAMLMSRYVFRDLVERRIGGRWATLREALDEHGGFYLYTLRMMPQVPFVVVNLVMGLSSIRWETFWWVSQLGMLPATCLYVYTGATLPSVATIMDKGIGTVITWPLVIALVLLGCFPLVTRLVLRQRA